MYASERNTTISTTYTVSDEPVDLIIDKIASVFEHSQKLSQKVKVISALKEIESQENGLESLTQEKRDLLYNAEKIIEQNKQVPKMLTLYKHILTQLYKSFHTLKGISNVQNMDTFADALENFDRQKITNLIKMDKY